MQKVAGVVLSIALTILLSRTTHARRIDCTKFVFAPVCRGVAAKRGVDMLSSVDAPDPLLLDGNTPDLDEVAESRGSHRNFDLGDMDEESLYGHTLDKAPRMRSSPLDALYWVRLNKIRELLTQPGPSRNSDDKVVTRIEKKLMEAYRRALNDKSRV